MLLDSSSSPSSSLGVCVVFSPSWTCYLPTLEPGQTVPDKWSVPHPGFDFLIQVYCIHSLNIFFLCGIFTIWISSVFYSYILYSCFFFIETQLCFSHSLLKGTIPQSVICWGANERLTSSYDYLIGRVPKLLDFGKETSRWYWGDGNLFLRFKNVWCRELTCDVITERAAEPLT